jgi:cobalt-zinc-cadmium efflux system membrane fusion protein
MYKLYIFLILSVFIAACSSSPKDDNAESEMAENEQPQLTVAEILKANPKIRIDSVRKKKASQRINCTGKIEVPPTEVISVHSRTAGFIESMKYLPGDYVKKGARLFSITNSELIEKQRLFLETKAELSLSNKTYERKRVLQAENATTAVAWDEAQAKKELLSATYNGLKSELKMLGIDTDALENEQKFQSHVTVYASHSGFVSEVDVNRGQMVSPETKLMEISNDAHIHLALQILSKDATLVAKDQRVEFTLPNNPKIMGAKIEKINPVLDDRTGTLNVHCHIDKKDTKYTIPGMFVNASISVEEREFSGLPLNAVIKEGNEYYAFVVVGEYLEKQLLDNTQVHGDFVTFDGLKSEQMVVSGAYYVE